MKTKILHHSIAALLLTALPIARAEDEKKAGEKNETKSTTSTVVSSADGTATVTIDINGKKETRTFKLGDGNNVFTFGKDGNGAKAAGGVFMKPDGKREKGPWIGIAMEPVQDVVRAQLPLQAGEGILVGHVAPDSPAAKAGLQTNDILVRFENQIIVEPSQLRKLIAMKKPGDTVKLTYLRKGESKETEATLIEHEIEHDAFPNAMQWIQGRPEIFTLPVPPPKGFKGDASAHIQDQLMKLKEKQPGVIVDKRAWISGGQSGNIKEQFEKLRQSLKGLGLSDEDIDKTIKQAQRAVEDTLGKINTGGQPDKEKAKKEKPEPKKKPDDTL